MNISVFLFINEQAKPSTAKWRVNPIRHYKLMEDLWGLDRATDHSGRTTLQSSSRTQSHHFNVDLNDHNMEEVPEEPVLDVIQFETPRSVDPNVDSYNPGPNLTPPLVSPQPSQPSGGTSSSRGSKRKTPMVDIIDLQLERLNKRFE